MEQNQPPPLHPNQTAGLLPQTGIQNSTLQPPSDIPRSPQIFDNLPPQNGPNQSQGHFAINGSLQEAPMTEPDALAIGDCDSQLALPGEAQFKDDQGMSKNGQFCDGLQIQGNQNIQCYLDNKPVFKGDLIDTQSNQTHRLPQTHVQQADMALEGGSVANVEMESPRIQSQINVRTADPYCAHQNKTFVAENQDQVNQQKWPKSQPYEQYASHHKEQSIQNMSQKAAQQLGGNLDGHEQVEGLQTTGNLKNVAGGLPLLKQDDQPQNNTGMSPVDLHGRVQAQEPLSSHGSRHRQDLPDAVPVFNLAQAAGEMVGEQESGLQNSLPAVSLKLNKRKTSAANMLRSNSVRSFKRALLKQKNNDYDDKKAGSELNEQLPKSGSKTERCQEEGKQGSIQDNNLRDTGSDQVNSTGKQDGRWTSEEHERFCQALRVYGKDWNQVSSFVGTRQSSQVRSHAQKFFRKITRGSGKPGFEEFISISKMPAKCKSSSRLVSPMLMPAKSQTPSLKPTARPTNVNCQPYGLLQSVALPEEALTMGKLHSFTVAHSANDKYPNDSKTSRETIQHKSPEHNAKLQKNVIKLPPETLMSSKKEKTVQNEKSVADQFASVMNQGQKQDQVGVLMQNAQNQIEAMQTDDICTSDKPDQQAKYQMRITESGLQIVQTQPQSNTGQADSQAQKNKVAPVFITTFDLDPERTEMDQNIGQNQGISIVEPPIEPDEGNLDGQDACGR